MNKVKKILADTSSIIGILSILSAAVYWGFDLDKRSFTSMENRVNAERQLEEGPTAEQKQRAMILDSVNNVHAVASRKKRDSILQEILDRQRHQDSINLLNADQMFQIKEEIKNIH